MPTTATERQSEPDAKIGCPAPDDGSEGGPTLSPCKQVKEETSSSTLLKTALDYLVKEQQLAELEPIATRLRPKSRILSKGSRVWACIYSDTSRSHSRARSVLRLNSRQTIKTRASPRNRATVFQ